MQSFIAHVRSSDHTVQSVETHLREAMEMAERRGEPFGFTHIAGLAGLLHDMGKFSDNFQTYIRKAVYTDERVKRGEVDHATAGGRYLYKTAQGMKGQERPLYFILAEIVGNAIISHHGNLHNLSDGDEASFHKRIIEKSLPEFDECVERFETHVLEQSKFLDYVKTAVRELDSFLKGFKSGAGVSKGTFYLTRLIFGILIDSDRTNTREFEEGKTERSTERISDYRKRFEEKMKAMNQGALDTPINRLRRDMSDYCLQYAERPEGIYTLSIPTGGGKTLSSLRYALAHAERYGKKRIIYIVPYTTIIEQNAAVVRDVLGSRELLEHHSNVMEDALGATEDQDEVMDTRTKIRLSKEDWDAPIIFTTMVQYLNTFYAKGNRNTRRLHNLGEAVLIFDEVQKVPVKCVHLFNESLNFLKNHMKTTSVLCTATQPALDFVRHQLEVTPDGEMVQNLEEVTEAFKRINLVEAEPNIQIDTPRLKEMVEKQVNQNGSVLVILNTKTVVRKLFDALRETYAEEELFHLSTSMCAAHRTEILHHVTERLKNGERVVCISSQLIEAGVDVSFGCVIRSLAGLDSIAQAAGRCNRHGERGRQNVYLVDHMEESLTRLPEIDEGRKIVRRMLLDMRRDATNYGGDLLSEVAMTRYFKEFYGTFDVKLDYPTKEGGITLMNLFMGPLRKKDKTFLPHLHEKAAKQFAVIEQNTKSILVPYGPEGTEIIAAFSGENSMEDYRTLMKRAQHYMVEVYPHHVKRLEEIDGLIPLLEGELFALQDYAYDKQYGLNLDGDSARPELIF